MHMYVCIFFSFVMDEIIDKQLEYLRLELEQDNENEKIIELIRVLTLFKDVFHVVLKGPKGDTSSLALFVSQLLTGRGEVDFVNVVSEFMKMHKITQKQIEEKTGTHQAGISKFLNRKHAIQSDTLTKMFSVVSPKKLPVTGA